MSKPVQSQNFRKERKDQFVENIRIKSKSLKKVKSTGKVPTTKIWTTKLLTMMHWESPGGTHWAHKILYYIMRFVSFPKFEISFYRSGMILDLWVWNYIRAVKWSHNWVMFWHLSFAQWSSVDWGEDSLWWGLSHHNGNPCSGNYLEYEDLLSHMVGISVLEIHNVSRLLSGRFLERRLVFWVMLTWDVRIRFGSVAHSTSLSLTFSSSF